MNRISSTVNVLTTSEIELIHESTCDILETVGLKVPHKEWLIWQKMQALLLIGTNNA